MGGRIDDIAVSESDPSIIYLGYAVGGVCKSENNGTTFEPVFDEQTTASIGDIAIHPTNPNIVYVGTGEPNNRQTSSFGDGIYKTTDGGKTFTHIGLRETQTIARIVIDPRNPETVYVAVPGHLFGPNTERGVYKTTDGGRNWNMVKFIDEDTGFTDIAIDPVNTNILYAASYQRRRMGCCFNGGGPGSALWKTTDGGKTLDEADVGPAARHLRPHRARRLALEPQRRLRADRSRSDRAAADDRRERSGRGDREHAGRRGGGAGSACRNHAVRRGCRGWPDAARRQPRPQAGALRLQAAAGVAVAASPTTGATTPGPARGFGRGDAAGRRHDAGAAPARSRPRRHLPLRQQGRELDARQQLQRAADVLQPDSASIRRTTRRSTSPGCRSRSRSTAARRSRRSTKRAATARRATSTSTRSGSIRRTRSTC